MDLLEHADRVADNLRASGTCTALVGGAEFTPEEFFAALRKMVPVLGVISTTRRTLHLTLVTENPRRLGHNNALNHRHNLDYARRIFDIDPSRVW